MGKSFNDSNGQAKKSDMEYIKLEMGTNKMRMVGELLPRYAYWKNLKDNSIPVECLSFSREAERFTNMEKDWFKHYFPEAKCVWSYVIQVIDLRDGKVKLCGLKKKLFEQIQDVATKHLGDPTNTESGWDIVFDKKKTGPNKFNVEYTLDVMSCKKRPLNEDELEAIKDLKSIDELVPRLTADEQKAFIEQAWINGPDEQNVDNSATKEFNNTTTDDAFDDDIPF